MKIEDRRANHIAGSLSRRSSSSAQIAANYTSGYDCDQFDSAWLKSSDGCGSGDEKNQSFLTADHFEPLMAILLVITRLESIAKATAATAAAADGHADKFAKYPLEIAPSAFRPSLLQYFRRKFESSMPMIPGHGGEPLGVDKYQCQLYKYVDCGAARTINASESLDALSQIKTLIDKCIERENKKLQVLRIRLRIEAGRANLKVQSHNPQSLLFRPLNIIGNLPRLEYLTQFTNVDHENEDCGRLEEVKSGANSAADCADYDELFNVMLDSRLDGADS